MISIGGLGGGGGYGMQEADPGLGDKLAALKRKRGNLDDKVTDFLTREIGVDPASLPFTYQHAREYLLSVFETGDFTQLLFTGNSMGLVDIREISAAADPVIITSNDDRYHDLVRSYSALLKEFAGRYSFRVESDYYEGLDVAMEPPKPVHFTDPTKYVPGTVLRIEKQRVDGPALVIDHLYIRIGGLFDDTTPIILDTMQPILDLTGWSVTEEL